MPEELVAFYRTAAASGEAFIGMYSFAFTGVESSTFRPASRAESLTVIPHEW